MKSVIINRKFENILVKLEELLQNLDEKSFII